MHPSFFLGKSLRGEKKLTLLSKILQTLDISVRYSITTARETPLLIYTSSWEDDKKSVRPCGTEYRAGSRTVQRQEADSPIMIESAHGKKTARAFALRENMDKIVENNSQITYNNIVMDLSASKIGS